MVAVDKNHVPFSFRVFQVKKLKDPRSKRALYLLKNENQQFVGVQNVDDSILQDWVVGVGD